MIEIIRKKSFISIREIYFSDAIVSSPVRRSVDVYIQMVAPKFRKSHIFKTILINLSANSNVLFESFTKGNRYEIRRALSKDDIECTFVLSASRNDVDEFVTFYNIFANFKSVSRANTEKLYSFSSENRLAITSARAGNTNEIFAMHCYLQDGVRTRLYYSATLPREANSAESKSVLQMIGRSNRLLHWYGMLKFKENNFKLYDLGGMSENLALKGINDFKRQFGGLEVCEYNFKLPVSILGHIILFFHKLFKGQMQ